MPRAEQDAFIDQVAQAVIDRIEERDRIAYLVEMVVQRVIPLQKEANASSATTSTESMQDTAVAGNRTRVEAGS